MYGEYCAKGDTLNSLKYICGFKSNIAWKFFKKKKTQEKDRRNKNFSCDEQFKWLLEDNFEIHWIFLLEEETIYKIIHNLRGRKKNEWKKTRKVIYKNIVLEN